MKEPRRLLSEGGTSALEHSLLSAGRARREREGARERVWGAVGVAVAGGAAVAGVSGTAAASTGAGAGAGAVSKGAGVAVGLAKMKLIVATAVLATAGSAAYVAVQQQAPVEPTPIVQTARIGTPSAAVVAKAQAARSRPEIPAVELPEQPKAKPKPSTSTSTSTSTSAGVGELREEAGMLGGVREALAAGDPRTAATRLQVARARFPKSRLGQERDVLEIRIASASGERARAASLARAFLARYPESPLRAGVEATVTE